MQTEQKPSIAAALARARLLEPAAGLDPDPAWLVAEPDDPLVAGRELDPAVELVPDPAGFELEPAAGLDDEPLLLVPDCAFALLTTLTVIANDKVVTRNELLKTRNDMMTPKK